ncbi:phosphoribosyltransferase [Streptomyces benahoarensis]|uniref:Phosphoribosyltransferase n=1 Tax=Streptomyces benahoarensis TaxID=2595054 RepID=A0A553ZK99_9ACTN|nr:phosphoribosyltransferase family protein [Streptomyces benahoarensis]TSB24535.1 phosphoribosyltransferase [Streptomyces benahoarensis]TSB41855.1 phosphoribosyltransferase [Streptomyces benahoarensis]
MRYFDRRHAGEALATRCLALVRTGALVDPLVVALPRGGVPVAAVVARALGAPLDVLVARKIGMPGRPEVGVGALVDEDPPVFDVGALAALGLTVERLAEDVERERAELRRRQEVYRAGRPPLGAAEVAGRAVLLVDDGLATGVTARAALRYLRRLEPARLVLAVPVGDAAAAAALREEADDVECVHQPRNFHGVGKWYLDFDQVQDAEVISILRGSGTAV